MTEFDPVDESLGRYWVVVADARKARLLHSTSRYGDLSEFHQITHEDASKKGRDLDTDRPGRRHDEGTGHSSAMPADPVERAKNDFASDLANWLDARRAEDHFDALSLIAPPSFLGEVRKRCSAPLKASVIQEIDKTLVRHSPEEIREALNRLKE